MPSKKKDLPGTLERSSKKAQETYAKTLDSAEDQYDDEARARQTAFASLKHSFEKVGDHWEEKDEKGPSDEHSKGRKNAGQGQTAGGVDAIGHTRDELLERARALDITGRSSMNKEDLARAIAQKQD